MQVEHTSVSCGAPTSEKWSSSVSNSSACFPDAMAAAPGSEHCCNSGLADAVADSVSGGAAAVPTVLVSGSSMLHQCAYVSAAMIEPDEHQLVSSHARQCRSSMVAHLASIASNDGCVARSHLSKLFSRLAAHKLSSSLYRIAPS